MFELSFRSFLPMMDADDGLDIGGTGEEELEPAEPAAEEGEEESGLAEPTEGRSDADAAFAEMRRQNEMLARQLRESEQRNADYEESVSEYERALGLYFEGDNKAAQAIAHYDEVPVEDVVRDMQERRVAKEQQKATESLAAERDKLLYENMKMKDLAELRAAGVNDIQDVEELGEEYFALRAMGIAPATVYEGIQMKKGIPPKAIGRVKPAAPEKSYLTHDEVEAMSPKERVKNFDKIRESMLHWK